MARPSLSKRLRFEIFKRDAFTCQYCGRQPPTVVLEVDHILAVANGGANDETNLVTACEDCNRGKSDKRLEVVRCRPDADLMYLETQQEIAELTRYQKAQARLMELRSSAVEMLQESWCSLSGLDWCPKDQDLMQMLAKFSVEDVDKAVSVTAAKVANRQVSGYKFVSYMWGVLHSIRREENDGA